MTRSSSRRRRRPACSPASTVVRPASFPRRAVCRRSAAIARATSAAGKTDPVDDEWGITDGYFDVDGAWHETSDETRDAAGRRWASPTAGPPMWFVAAATTPNLWNRAGCVLEDGTDLGEVSDPRRDLPIGYHDLSPVDGARRPGSSSIPPCPPVPPRKWGVAAGSTRCGRDRSWGIGDLGDLACLAVASATTRAAERCCSARCISRLRRCRRRTAPTTRAAGERGTRCCSASTVRPPTSSRAEPSQLIDRDDVWAAKRAVARAAIRGVERAPAAADPRRDLERARATSSARPGRVADRGSPIRPRRPRPPAARRPLVRAAGVVPPVVPTTDRIDNSPT